MAVETSMNNMSEFVAIEPDQLEYLPFPIHALGAQHDFSCVHGINQCSYRS